MIALALLLALLLVAAATDALRHKIYNWNVYPGVLLGLALNASGVWLSDTAQADRWQRLVGWIPHVENPLADSLLGFAACGLAMLVCYVFFAIGGGDVKLMALLGAFLGLEQGVQAMLWTLILGGLLGLLVLIWRLGAGRMLLGAGKQFVHVVRTGRPMPLTEETRALLKTRLFLAPMALPAVFLVKFDWLA